MKQSERMVLVIIGVIGSLLMFLIGGGTLAWFFLMVAAFIGECVEVIANRMEKILTTLESQE